MAFWESFKSALALTRTKDEPEQNQKEDLARAREVPIPPGRKTISGLNYGTRTLSPLRSRNRHVLECLRRIHDKADAIEFLREENSDVSMSVWNFIRLANQGHEMHFYDPRTNKRTPEIESEWTKFAARVNEISNAGMDGLVDILHQSAFMRGAQGIEVEVNAARNDIVDVHPVIPQTIEWEFEERKGRKIWIPYQRQFTEKVSLEPGKANFFWVPTDPLINDPRGTLILTPAIQAIDFQMQILQDLQAVLHHTGWPRNDLSILLENTMNIMPPQVKAAGQEEQEEWLAAQLQNVIDMMNELDPDSDYIHYDNIQINMQQGANTSRGMDVRAVAELVDIQVLNGLKQLGTFANRTNSKTETWSTVEFLITTQGIKACQRGSKRIFEEMARLWLRVRGLQSNPSFQHNPVNYQSEKDKKTLQLLEEQIYAFAVLMGWIDNDRAAQDTWGEPRAKGNPTEQIRISLSGSGEGTIKTGGST
ncbi:MAG: hypothetical protein HPY66_1658 [Firmicutes bacterium]|nr:hypothetical protein [Bacillota bacterium]